MKIVISTVVNSFTTICQVLAYPAIWSSEAHNVVNFYLSLIIDVSNPKSNGVDFTEVCAVRTERHLFQICACLWEPSSNVNIRTHSKSVCSSKAKGWPSGKM